MPAIFFVLVLITPAAWGNIPASEFGCPFVYQAEPRDIAENIRDLFYYGGNPMYLFISRILLFVSCYVIGVQGIVDFIKHNFYPDPKVNIIARVTLLFSSSIALCCGTLFLTTAVNQVTPVLESIFIIFSAGSTIVALSSALIIVFRNIYSVRRYIKALSTDNY